MWNVSKENTDKVKLIFFRQEKHRWAKVGQLVHSSQQVWTQKTVCMRRSGGRKGGREEGRQGGKSRKGGAGGEYQAFKYSAHAPEFAAFSTASFPPHPSSLPRSYFPLLLESPSLFPPIPPSFSLPTIGRPSKVDRTLLFLFLHVLCFSCISTTPLFFIFPLVMFFLLPRFPAPIVTFC